MENSFRSLRRELIQIDRKFQFLFESQSELMRPGNAFFHARVDQRDAEEVEYRRHLTRRTLAAKGQGLKQIAKALNRSEESTKSFAKQNKIKIAKKR